MTEIALRRCLREPVPAIFRAAELLDRAVDAHLQGDSQRAEQLFRESDLADIREWTESLWGAKSPYSKPLHDIPPALFVPDHLRTPQRMPNGAMQLELHKRDGYHCRFCGIPVIRKQVRQKIQKVYPHLMLWGRKNIDQHAAFQAMWAQYDHIVPHAQGGTNELGNMIVTCAPCNFGKMDMTLEQLGLSDPRVRAPVHSTWDGLARFH